jgi:hypothetical protein
MEHDPIEAPNTGPKRPLVLGWKERIALPEWGIPRLRVKVDTGARSSALDVVGYELIEVAGQGLLARLRLALSRKHPERIHVVEAPVLRQVLVRNSGGVAELRPLVETWARIGPVHKRIRLTVTQRSGLRFRMLLGRQALQSDFVVDVSKKYLL